MRIFTDRTFKLQFTVIALAFLLLTILGQYVVKHMADDYKQNLISHDYGVAGYLMHNKPEGTKIAEAFTAAKTDIDIETGRELLQASGYTSNIQNSLLPEADYFHRKFAVISLILSIAFFSAILLALLYFAFLRNKKIERASMDIQGFMGGNLGIRLDDRGEDDLSKLFASVNLMATAQTAHIAKEKQNREFLRDTITDISHQLKTPLAALKMYNEIIENERTGNEIVESFTSKSQRELVRMESLIQNLLKLAKLDAGSIELERNMHNLKAFLEEALKGFRTRADLEGKAILLYCNEHITMNFDEEWLLEAISNIIKNALDHTEDKNHIVIRCEETPILTQITIEDNGTGIHPEDIHHIFRRFYRSRFSKDKQGIGIGLTLSKAIIDKNGGTVTVESELGKGTIFRMAFPKLSNL